MPNNMRTRGEDINTDFGQLKQAGFELPLARMQKTSIEKAATIFDKYDVRVTIESKAGHTNQSYTEVLSALKDAGLLYREDRRYTIKPDRDCIDILIEKEDMPVIAELNKALGDSGFKFLVSENLPEYIQPRSIVTPEDELDKTKDVKKAEASKKTAANEWVSKDGKIKIYETFHDFQIEHVPSGESQGMGDGVDMFSDAEGNPIDVGTPEFEQAMADYVNSPDLIDGYFPNVVEGSKDDISEGTDATKDALQKSKKTASAQFSPQQIEFLFGWAQWEVNYSAPDLEEYARATNNEDVYNSLPADVKEGGAEALKTEIPWGDVETGSIKRGYNVIPGRDYGTGAKVYMLYPESTSVGVAELVLKFWTNNWDKEDYEELTGDKFEEGVEADYDYINIVTNDLAKQYGLIFINPYDRNGSVFDFLGEELYKDGEGNVYLTGAAESTEEKVKKAPKGKGKSRKSVSDLQDKKAAYDEANDGLDLMGALEKVTAIDQSKSSGKATPDFIKKVQDEIHKELFPDGEHRTGDLRQIRIKIMKKFNLKTLELDNISAKISMIEK